MLIEQSASFRGMQAAADQHQYQAR